MRLCRSRDLHLVLCGRSSVTYLLSSLTGLGRSFSAGPSDESLGYFLSPSGLGIQTSAKLYLPACLSARG